MASIEEAAERETAVLRQIILLAAVCNWVAFDLQRVELPCVALKVKDSSTCVIEYFLFVTTYVSL